MTGEPVTDLVVRNARVCTLDPACPWAGAVAVRAGGPDPPTAMVTGSGECGNGSAMACRGTGPMATVDE